MVATVVPAVESFPALLVFQSTFSQMDHSES